MKKIVFTDQAPKPIGPYSQAVDTGSTIYLAGQLGIDPLTGKLLESMQEQTKQAFKNAEQVLKSAGYNLSDVVKVTCLLYDLNDFQVMNEIYGTIFTSNYPARTAFQAAKLPLGAMIEIEIIASKS